MPRVIDYPRGSFGNALEIAAIVAAAGGRCSVADCAERLGKKVSGAFKALVSAAIKHGLLVNRREVLTITPLYRRYQQAGNEAEKLGLLRQAFLLPPLYHRIFERYKGQELPSSGLDELMVQEFGADEAYASRLVGYFTEGVRQLQLTQDGRLSVAVPNLPLAYPEPDEEPDYPPVPPRQQPTPQWQTEQARTQARRAEKELSFAFSVDGPELKASFRLGAEEDLRLAEAVLTAIRSRLGKQQ